MLSSPRFGMTYHRDLDATDVGELILKKLNVRVCRHRKGAFRMS